MIDRLNFEKMNGLVPAVIQDATTRRVLMVGFMNREALKRTLLEQKVTFWSRTKKRFWQKGESSGNFLGVVSVQVDCDGDALLVYAHPTGPVCHTGSYTCFGDAKDSNPDPVFERLENIIRERHLHMPQESYTATLFQQGTARIAQKVGEEAIEAVVAAVQGKRESLKEESADLLYHLLVLLQAQGLGLTDVAGVLEKRMEKATPKDATKASPAG
jgi:phosphoribosyl-ATP pyrophosphohydrolase/phosphoribosyl-AMP cyclohydrolase